MLYSLTHLLLLLAATLGVWVVRRRALLVVGGLLLFPLPAALYNYLAAPIPDVVASLTDSGSATVGCASNTQPSRADGAASSKADRDEEGRDVKTDCGSSDEPPRQQILTVTLVLNYLTVLIGFLTGMLCRRTMAAR